MAPRDMKISQAAQTGDLAAALNVQPFNATHIFQMSKDLRDLGWAERLDGTPVMFVRRKGPSMSVVRIKGDGGYGPENEFCVGNGNLVDLRSMEPVPAEVDETALETLEGYIPEPTHYFQKFPAFAQVKVSILAIRGGMVRICSTQDENNYTDWVKPGTLTPIKVPTAGCSNTKDSEPVPTGDGQDLVRFILPRGLASVVTWAKALREALGINYGYYDKNHPLTVTCRLDQYARFCIMTWHLEYRVESEIIKAVDRTNIVDVTGR